MRQPPGAPDPENLGARSSKKQTDLGTPASKTHARTATELADPASLKRACFLKGPPTFKAAHGIRQNTTRVAASGRCQMLIGGHLVGLIRKLPISLHQ